MAPLSSSPGTVEQTQSHRVSKQLIYIEPETEDRAGAPRWYAWFGTWDPFQEGEELIVTLADGRKGTGIVRRVYIDADLVDPIVYVDGNGTLE